MEDLWAFNDEKVARSIFAAHHPIIVGVGHETDFTVADFVADVRAPTPSAAAELAVPDGQAVSEYVESMKVALASNIRQTVRERYVRLESLQKNLSHLSPRTKLENSWQQLDWLVRRLDIAITAKTHMVQARLSLAIKGLESLNPLATLTRGYAIVQRADGEIVRQTKDVTSGETLRIQVADGDISATAK
jgi:exodeoxyribonuclease VII large subunit